MEGKKEEYTKDQMEVLDEISHIIDMEIAENIEEMFFAEMAEHEKAMEMYEGGLNSW